MWISPFFVTKSRYPHVNNLCLTKYHLYTVSTIVLFNFLKNQQLIVFVFASLYLFLRDWRFFHGHE